jgi:hypothetical protein
MKKPTPSSHTHCQVAQSQPHEPKLVKEYARPNAEKRKENKTRKHNNVYSAYHPAGCYDTIHQRYTTLEKTILMRKSLFFFY